MDKWDKRFMQMAYTIADWSSCFRAGRSIGCVIVKDKRIMTTGYNGAPSGIKTCREKGECLRDKLGIPSGTRMETCYAVHAEQNAIVQAAKEYHVLLEINEHSLLPGTGRENAWENDREMLTWCKKLGVPVILDSDAHFSAYIGEFERADALLQEVGFPEELVVNRSVEAYLSFMPEIARQRLG